jgi:hypothetical protein
MNLPSVLVGSPEKVRPGTGREAGLGHKAKRNPGVCETNLRIPALLAFIRATVLHGHESRKNRRVEFIRPVEIGRMNSTLQGN